MILHPPACIRNNERFHVVCRTHVRCVFLGFAFGDRSLEFYLDLFSYYSSHVIVRTRYSNYCYSNSWCCRLCVSDLCRSALHH